MKYTLTVLTTILTLTVFGQSAQEYSQNGINKHTQQDYKGAIKEYDKAIKINRVYTEAYFNRGICELALKEFKAAMKGTFFLT